MAPVDYLGWMPAHDGMTKDEDLQRIALSRHIFGGYAAAVRAGNWPLDDLHRMRDEVAMLEALVEEHPFLMESVTPLVRDWRALIAQIAQKLN